MENLPLFQERLKQGYHHLWYDGDETLWGRFFDSDCDRVGCCVESSSSCDEEFYNNAEEAQVSSSDDEVDSEDNH